jgi:hypothetical protein
MELFFNFRHMSFINHQLSKMADFKIYFRKNIFLFREKNY